VNLTEVRIIANLSFTEGHIREIRPFSFREFLRHRGEEPESEAQRWSAGERSLVEGRLGEFVTEGGFPEAQGLAAFLRIELFQGYVDTVLFRDVVERYEVTQVAALRWVVRQCLRNPAGSFSVHRLHQDLKAQGPGLVKDAVHGMVGHLLDAFLLSAVPLATEFERLRNSNPRKFYPVDPGLIRAFVASGRSNVGRALETAVANELERCGMEIGYQQTLRGREVDFLVRHPAGGTELVQVCADLANADTLTRELQAFTDPSPRFEFGCTGSPSVGFTACTRHTEFTLANTFGAGLSGGLPRFRTGGQFTGESPFVEFGFVARKRYTSDS